MLFYAMMDDNNNSNNVNQLLINSIKFSLILKCYKQIED